MSELMVNLGRQSYAIHYSNQLEADLLKTMEPFREQKICLVSDKNVFDLYGPTLFSILRKTTSMLFSFVFPSGEENKNWRQVEQLVQFLMEKGWNRDEPLVVLGGGVTGDMGGFAASIVMRGVPLIHVPTTILAQVDSSIGGKTGVNHAQGKNLIGTFYQPRHVLESTFFYSTLPVREVRTGFSEVIKYGMIRDAKLFAELTDFFADHEVEDFQNFPESFWTKTIMKCAAIKADIVSRDERESKLRMILNYGHTFGHAIERITSYKVYTHGEAVAIGMNCAAYVGWRLGFCREDVYLQQSALLQRMGLPISLDKSILIDEMMDALKMDKKVQGQRLTLILPEKIGKVRIETTVQAEALKPLLEAFQK